MKKVGGEGEQKVKRAEETRQRERYIKDKSNVQFALMG